MEITRKAIGLRIRALREDRRLNQKEFARELRISNTTLSTYENGDSYPSLNVLARISGITGKSFDWILFGAPMPKIEKEEISEQEIRLLQLFRRSQDKDREMILRMAELASKSKSKSGKLLE